MLEDFRLKEFSKDKAKMLNPLQLAIVGDAVYEVFVRTYIISENENLSAHKIHRKAIEFVKAQAQSKIMHKIEDELLEDEKYIYKRGRNAKSATVPKNADVRDYRMATGFEALLGYLYLSGQKDRQEYILNRCIEVINQSKLGE